MINGINNNIFKDFQYKNAKAPAQKASIPTHSAIPSDKKTPEAKTKEKTTVNNFLASTIALLIPLSFLFIRRYAVPKDYRQFFKSLEKITDKKEYAKQSYEGLVKILNMQDIAPEKLTTETLGASAFETTPSTIAGHAFLENSINLNESAINFFEDDKGSIVGSLRHELEHCKQSNFLLQHIDAEKYAKIVLENKYGQMNYDAPFFKALLEHSKKTVQEGYKTTLNKPKTAPTPEIQDRINKYIKKKKNYSTETEKAYKENLLEKEAFEAQAKIEKMYNKYYLGPLSVFFKSTKFKS